jgi:magnesium-transporting ATPase (P-type)
MGNPPSEHSDHAWHGLTAQQALEAQHSSANGLSQAEAELRLQRHGANRLPPPKRRGPLLRLLYQFHNVLLYLMLVAAVIMHVYAAIWVKGTVRAMTRGTVSESWAKANHPLWHQEMTRKP